MGFERYGNTGKAAWHEELRKMNVEIDVGKLNQGILILNLVDLTGVGIMWYGRRSRISSVVCYTVSRSAEAGSYHLAGSQFSNANTRILHATKNSSYMRLSIADDFTLPCRIRHGSALDN